MDNPQQYGFRVFRGGHGLSHSPEPEKLPIASGHDFNINGDATDYDLNIGDPVTLLSTGYVTLCEGSEASGGTADPLYGIVTHIFPVWDGEVMENMKKVPSGVTYGSNALRKTYVGVVPVTACLWEADCDAILSGATALADYEALVGENVDHVLQPDSTTLKLTPRIDISGHATTSLQWRIHGVSPTMYNQDFSGNYVKLLLKPNEVATQLVEGGTTGV